ncbi:J domain-containing protein [Ramlibacter sp.]|uniref:J domain-containing protein n=1 Tax=Ramlibacter sp. TaxID=1917967 RepID=UPI003D0A91B0
MAKIKARNAAGVRMSNADQPSPRKRVVASGDYASIGSGPGLIQRHDNFDTLVRDVEHWRAVLTQWEARIARYEQVTAPVRHELHAAWREWVFALDEATLQPAFARHEREQLRGWLLEAAGALLEGEDDAGVASVANRHADPSPAAPGDGDRAIHEAGEVIDDALPDWEREAAAAAAQRAEWAAQRRAAAGEKRSRQAAEDTRQSLRDVYRRLASAVHPDRESDAAQRARKTALMQQANEAYARDDLHALLELQRRAGALDAAQAVAADPRRLQHYTALLQEQLAALQSRVRQLESEFRAATGLAPGSGLQPRKADRQISAETQRLRADLLGLRRQIALLRDVEETRRWLREERQNP